MTTTKTGSYRWTICALLFAATTINYLDRQVLGLLKPVLEKQFSWTETDYGRIVTAFTAAYAIGLMISGRFIDRIGTKLGYTISITIWSIASMLHALVRSTLGFGFARVLLGIGESGNFPAAVKTVAEWFPKKERALAAGIFDSGSNIGACVAPIMVPWLLGLYGWHEAFIITGALGFIWLACWLYFYEIPAKNKRLKQAELDYINSDSEATDEAEDTTPVQWSKILKTRQAWIFIAGKFLTDPVWYFFLYWLPSYFSTTFHLDFKKPSLPLVIVYTAATIGAIGGGYLSSWLIKKGWPVYKARKLALLLSAVCVIPVVAARYTSDIWMVVGLISLSVLGNSAWSANLYTLVSDMFPKKAVSSLIGIGGTAGAIAGTFFPLFIGFILDYYKGVGNTVAGYNIIFLICSLSFVLAYIVMHFLSRKMKPVKL